MTETTLTTLNQDQQQAVTHSSGPALVLAGAGSGKTKVLTQRVIWLAQNGLTTINRIVVVTFTNKATNEIVKRLQDYYKNHFYFNFVGTFHSICSRILREDGHHIGLDQNFSIFDQEDQGKMVKLIIKNYFSNIPENIKIGFLTNKISRYKNDLLTPEEAITKTENEFDFWAAKVYSKYQKEMKKNNAVDFDDLIYLTVKMFNERKSLLEKYQTMIDHVLIDEYQDTNYAQHQLSKILSFHNESIFVVGDFSQSIYSWRGAKYQNLQDLKKTYPNIKEYKLERNYRSSPEILNFASHLIAYNQSHPILKLWTKKPSNEKVTLLESFTEEDQAQKIIKIIQSELIDYQLNQIAIFYRVNSQSRILEEVLIKNNLPYRIYGGIKFYQRKEIKDLLAYLKIIYNPQDSLSQNRVEKIGKRKFNKFKNALNSNREIIKETPSKLLSWIIEETEYTKNLNNLDPQDISVLDNIQELISLAEKFQSTAEMIESITITENESINNLQQTSNHLSLMSMHMAKGLEFDVVFIIGCIEGLIPHQRSLFDKEEIEEERRLLYVGSTRAREKLYLSYYQYGKQNGISQYNTKSRFLQEVPESLIQNSNKKQEVKKIKIVYDPDLYEDYLNQ